jgi:hypothetical protein
MPAAEINRNMEFGDDQFQLLFFSYMFPSAIFEYIVFKEMEDFFFQFSLTVGYKNPMGENIN